MVMVVWVNKNFDGLGGYIFIFVLVVIFYEVVFNYFFCGWGELGYEGDMIYF